MCRFDTVPLPAAGAGLAQPDPLAVAGEVEASGDEGVDGVAEEDLGEWILAVGIVEEALNGLVADLEQLVTGEAGLVLFDAFLDPFGVVLACGGEAKLPHGAGTTMSDEGGSGRTGGRVIVAGSGNKRIAPGR